MDRGDSDSESSDNDGDVDSSEVSSSDSDTPRERTNGDEAKTYLKHKKTQWLNNIPVFLVENVWFCSTVKFKMSLLL